MYEKFFKRILDFLLSLIALAVLSPILLILTVVGAIAMKGNPFFVQKRPGKKDKNGTEKIFSLIKFRTMTCEKDADGNLLPDEKRLIKYGKIFSINHGSHFTVSLLCFEPLASLVVNDAAFAGTSVAVNNQNTTKTVSSATFHRRFQIIQGICRKRHSFFDIDLGICTHSFTA